MRLRYLFITLFLTLVIGLAIFKLLYQKTPSPFEADVASLTLQQQLGKHLFEDINLSEPSGVSCASCHTPSQAFQGNNNSSIPAVAQGSKEGHFGIRNVPTLAYISFTPSFHFSKEIGEDGEISWKAIGGQFWDGRAQDLVAQAEGPLLNPNEMNNATKQMVVEKVKVAAYAPLMLKLYGSDVFKSTDVAFEKISIAIADFQSTSSFSPFSSKFDRVLEGKDTFSPLEAKGFALFKDPNKGNCIACHTGEENSKNPKEWLFTDYSYDNLGLPRNDKIPYEKGIKHYDLGLCKQPDIEKHAPQEISIASLCGAFKVPTLRNIALTAPYGHNGNFKELRDIVNFYATRDTNPELWYSKDTTNKTNVYDDLPKEYIGNVNRSEVPYDRKQGETPRLTDEEIDAIVAFLNTLTDEVIK